MSEPTSSGESEQSIPSREDINEALGESYTQATYEGYHKPIFEYLAEFDEGDQIGTSELIEKTIDEGPKSDVTYSTKVDKVRDVLKVSPELSRNVADRFPVGESLVQQAMERVGLDDELSPERLTDVQQACEAVGEEAELDILQFHAEGMKHSAAETADIDLEETDGISGEELDTLLAQFAKEAAETLPDEVTSIENAKLTSGGHANELLAVRALESQELSEGDDRSEAEFWHSGGSEDEDLVIFSNGDHADLNVEVKSKNARERVARALVDINYPTVLFAFLNDASEVRNGILSGGESDGSGAETDLRRWPEESIAAYVPQDTIERVKQIDQGDDQTVTTYEKAGVRYLRPCSQFPSDMVYYREHGEIPELDRDE